MLTGLHPARARRPHQRRLPARARRADCSPKRCAPRGYATGAFIGGYPLQASSGLARGFDRYDDDFLRAAGARRAFGRRGRRRGASPGSTQHRVAAVLRLAAPVRSALAVHAARAVCRRTSPTRRTTARSRTPTRRSAACSIASSARPLLPRRHRHRRRSRRVARRARRAHARHVSLRRDRSRAAARQACRRERPRAQVDRPRRNRRSGADDRRDSRRDARQPSTARTCCRCSRGGATAIPSGRRTPSRTTRTSCSAGARCARCARAGGSSSRRRDPSCTIWRAIRAS